MNSARIKECTELASDILKNFELSELPMSNIVLKCLRLCRLMDDEDGILLFTYESTGYPSTPDGMPSDSWRIAQLAGRRYKQKETVDDKTVTKEYAKTQLLPDLEEAIVAQKIRLSAATDPNVSISSANPYQHVHAPEGNVRERNNIVTSIRDNQNLIQIVKGNLYNYVLSIYNKLMYGNIVEDTFTKSRLAVNDKLAVICPKAIGKFVTVYSNMDSDNPEDWANAVHSCRRVLLDLADALYPPRDEPIICGGKQIKVGQEQYINRLIQFVLSRNGSKTYSQIVGADLASIGERLDAIYNATNKGTHSDVSKEEAARYIVHTYLLISDIIALVE